MIKLAKHAEANAKLQPKKAPKGSINITQKWLYVLFIALLAFQVYLNISAYYAVLQGMKNYSLFIIGIMMLVFAAMFHVYRYGRARAKAPPPRPVPPTPSRPAAAPTQAKPAPATIAGGEAQKPMASPQTVTTRVGSEQVAQLSQKEQQQKNASSAAVEGSVKTGPVQNDPQSTRTVSGDGPDKKSA
jgi:ubiquinol-cytochrome c reductase cytochrome b subunit